MPQATSELRKRWNHDNVMEGDAMMHLRRRGFTFSSGFIKPKQNYEPDEDDYSAIGLSLPRVGLCLGAY